MIINEKIPPIHTGSTKARLHLGSAHTYFGEPSLTVGGPQTQQQMAKATFSEEYYYINNTFRDVSVMKRDGLSFTIRHSNSNSCSDFIIRKIIKLKAESLETALANLTAEEALGSCELEEIRKCLLTVERGKYSEASVMLDYSISIPDLNKAGESVYHCQSDSIISLKMGKEIPAHPASIKYLDIGKFGVVNSYGVQNELNLKIRLVDHSPNAKVRYINLVGHVFPVHPQRDAPQRKISVYSNVSKTQITHSDYVQVFYTKRSADGCAIGVDYDQLTIAEAKDKIGLYDTYAEASNPDEAAARRKSDLLKLSHELETVKAKALVDKAELDRIDNIRKTELAEKLHQTELVKQQAALLKARLDIKEAEQKTTQSELDAKMQVLKNEKIVLDMQKDLQEDVLKRNKAEYDQRIDTLRAEHSNRLDSERQAVKDYYERRSLARKDTSDALKYIPGLMIGVVGIATTYFKLSGKK